MGLRDGNRILSNWPRQDIHPPRVLELPQHGASLALGSSARTVPACGRSAVARSVSEKNRCVPGAYSVWPPCFGTAPQAVASGTRPENGLIAAAFPHPRKTPLVATTKNRRYFFEHVLNIYGNDTCETYFRGWYVLFCRRCVVLFFSSGPADAVVTVTAGWSGPTLEI